MSTHIICFHREIRNYLPGFTRSWSCASISTLWGENLCKQTVLLLGSSTCYGVKQYWSMTYRSLHGWVVNIPDFSSWVLRFVSHWRQNSAYDCLAFHCTVLFITILSPAGSATFFGGDWSWNIFYGRSLPFADSRRAVVGFWWKNVHNTG